MKKLLSLFVMLSACINVWADTFNPYFCGYHLWKSCTVTSATKNLEKYITSGSLTVDYANYTITIKDLVASYDQGVLSFNRTEHPWTVRVDGNCSFTSSLTSVAFHACIETLNSKDVIFEGIHQDGSDVLTLINNYEVPSSQSIYSNSNINCVDLYGTHTLTLRNLTLDVQAPNGLPFDACADQGKEYPSLVLDGVDMSVKGRAEYCPISNFYSVTWKNTEIVYPTGNIIYKNKYFYNGGSKVFGEIRFEVPKYDLTVAGIMVTALNKDDILGDQKVSFSPANYPAPPTLWLANDAIIYSNDGYAVVWGKSYTDQHRIAVLGDAWITSKNGVIFDNNSGTLTICDGSGNLTSHLYLRADNIDHCLYCTYGEVIFRDLQVTAQTSGNKCLVGQSGSANKLTIDNCLLSLSAKTYAIAGFKTYNEIDCYHTGASYYSSTKRMLLNKNDEGLTSFSTLRGSGIWVADTEVTSENSSDVLNDGGSVRYDEGTLYLKNFNCSKASYGIRSFKPINVKFTGKNVIDGDRGIHIAAVASDGASPSLTLAATTTASTFTIKSTNIGIYAYAGGMKFTSGTYYINAGTYGICGFDGCPHEQLIVGADVIVKGSSQGAVVDFKSISMINGKQVVSPYEAKVGTVNDHAAVVTSSNSLVKGSTPVIFGTYDLNADSRITVADLTTLNQRIKSFSSYEALRGALIQKILTK